MIEKQKADLFLQIDEALKTIGAGCTCPDQAHKMAEAVLEVKPQCSVEIGVYCGKGLVTLGLAHRVIGYGKAIGIDPWDRAASLDGVTDHNEIQCWTHEDHEANYQRTQANIDKHNVREFVEIIRKRSDDTDPPENIGFLRIDGNHCATAFRDLTRFCPNVILGGILHLDDLNWKGGVSEHGALKYLSENGWTEIYEIETGRAYRKIKL